LAAAGGACDGHGVAERHRRARGISSAWPSPCKATLGTGPSFCLTQRCYRDDINNPGQAQRRFGRDGRIAPHRRDGTMMPATGKAEAGAAGERPANPAETDPGLQSIVVDLLIPQNPSPLPRGDRRYRRSGRAVHDRPGFPGERSRRRFRR
jgi:hypothetical protein